MSINTRQIVLNILCDIYLDKNVMLCFDDESLNRKMMNVRTLKIIRETNKKTIICQQVLPPNGYYGFFDRPALGTCEIPKENISLIVYREDVDITNTPSLDLYREGDKIEVEIEDIRNWSVGKLTPKIWRKAVVTSTGWVHPNRGARHAPYPYIQYTFIRTYWKGDSNGNGEFYDKESTERAYTASQVRFSNTNVVTV